MKIKPFYLTSQNNGKAFTLYVEQTELNDSFERFTLSAGGRSIIIQSDRPNLGALKSGRKIKWQLYSGKYKNVEALAWTLMLLDKKIQEFENAENKEVKPKVENGKLS